MSALLEPEAETSSLRLARAFFARLHSEGIAYCHWKSNEHLTAGVAGATDLDLLVDRRATVQLDRVLAALGFKRCLAPAKRAYPGIEDFLGFDAETGALIHLHIHHQLVLGEKGLKGYRLPWEDVLLATRVVDPVHGIYTADPNLELLLLMIRAALKLRTRDLVRGIWGRSPFGAAARRELEWLAERVTPDSLERTARPLVGEEAARLLVTIAAGVPTTRQLRAIAERAVPPLHQYRTYAASEALQRRWSQEWTSRSSGRAGRGWRATTPSKHTLPQGGLVIAFLGCDGSGKSTLAERVTAWLGWKLDVQPIYFGSGNGPASLLREPLRLLKSLRRPEGRPRAGGPRPDRSRPRQGLRGVRDAWWTLTLARERQGRLAQARQARNLGMVVVCDRYPQNQIVGYNDGPRLSGWLDHRSAVLRGLAERELATYRSADWSPPDLVLKLDVASEVAARRKPEMSRAWIAQRAEAIRGLRFPPATRVVEIDANQPLEQVLLAVKRAIWDHL